MRTARSITTLVAIFVVSILCEVSTGYAASIASFVNGIDEDADALTNLSDAADITVSDLSNVGFEGGYLITRNSYSDPNYTPGSNEWLFARASKVQSVPVATNDYFGFRVTSDTDQRLYLGNLTFDRTLARYAGGGLITKFEVFVSVNGGEFISFGSQSMEHADDTNTLNTFLSPVTQTNDLSAIQNARSVEIRIALGDNSSSASKAAWIQHINLDGSLGQPLSPPLLARYAAGQSPDGSALIDIMSATNVSASRLSRVGFQPDITTTNFPPTATNAVPAPGANEWLYAQANYVLGRYPGGGATTNDTSYFGFTVTATGGNQLYLDELKFDRTVIAETNTTLTARFEVYVAVDGGTFTSYGYADMIQTGAVFHAPEEHTVDLSSLRGVNSVEIRIALGDNSGSAKKASFIKDIRLSGESCPELGMYIFVR